MGIVAGRALGPIEIRLVLAELLLHGRDQAEIVLGVLIIVLGRHGIARRLRVARELHVLLGDMIGRTANLDVRAVRLVDARQWIVALAVTPPHALVLTVPHGSLVCQPLFCDGLTPPIDFNDNSLRMSLGMSLRSHNHIASCPAAQAAGLRGARSSNCRPLSRDGPMLPSKCCQQEQPAAWRLPSLPAWCAQLRSKAATLPAFHHAQRDPAGLWHAPNR